MIDTQPQDTLESRLAEAEASEQAPPDFSEQIDQSVQQSAPEVAEVVPPSPDSLPTDTLATAEPKPIATEKKVEAETQGSPFKKDAIRRDTSWKALNVEKDVVRKERDDLTQQREAFKREQESFRVEQAKKSQSFTPEQYIQGADNLSKQADTLDLQAKGLKAKAQELEDDGKYSEAEAAKSQAETLRNKAIVARGKAEDAKEMAEHVRKNPEPTLEAVNQKKAQAQQHYTLEAAKKWPELAKENSEFQKQVVANLQALQKSDPDLANNPSIIYHVAERTALMTEAARVPGIVKELDGLKAKVKDLEALTTPSNEGSVTRLPQGRQQPLNDEQEEAELRDMAMQRR